MDLTDILLALILAVLVRREAVRSQWISSQVRNIRRKRRDKRKGNDGK